MLNSLGLILLLSSVAVIPGGRCSKLERRDDSKVSEGNNYLDDVIARTIEDHKVELEPYHPENMTFTFDHKVMFVTLKREVSLYNMAITGLTTVHREGNCERESKDGVSKLSANLGMGVLEFESKATVKFMKMGPTFKIFGRIGYVMINLVVERDNNAGTPPKVKKLEIYDQKGTEVKVSEMGPLNKFAEVIIKAATKVFKGKMNRKLEEKLKESFNKKFQQSKFPID